MDEKFRAIDVRFQAVDVRFQSVETRFQSLEAKMESGFRELESRLVIRLGTMMTLILGALMALNKWFSL